MSALLSVLFSSVVHLWLLCFHIRGTAGSLGQSYPKSNTGKRCTRRSLVPVLKTMIAATAQPTLYLWFEDRPMLLRTRTIYCALKFYLSYRPRRLVESLSPTTEKAMSSMTPQITDPQTDNLKLWWLYCHCYQDSLAFDVNTSPYVDRA